MKPVNIVVLDYESSTVHVHWNCNIPEDIQDIESDYIFNSKHLGYDALDCRFMIFNGLIDLHNNKHESA